MMKLKEMNIIPGRDIAVVGFDDIPEATIFSPKLTTISSAPRLMGVHAARLLQARMEGLDIEPQNVILDPELVVRESSAYAQLENLPGFTKKEMETRLV